MKIFHIKSIVLGVGMGIVLTSVVSMIYLAGINPNTKMTKEEIIREAEKLGMVENTELVSEEQPAVTGAKKLTEINPVEKEKAAAEATPPIPESISFSVNSGDSSEVVAGRLQEKGLISDKNLFIKELKGMGLETKINVGNFKIEQGAEMKDIIRLLTKQGT